VTLIKWEEKLKSKEAQINAVSEDNEILKRKLADQVQVLEENKRTYLNTMRS
jgi:hypothetical protein